MFRLILALLLIAPSVAMAKKPARRPVHEHVLVVIDADQLEAAGAAMVAVAGSRARNTFSVPMETVDKRVCYVASGAWLTAEQVAAFKSAMNTSVTSKKVRVFGKAKDATNMTADEYDKPKDKLKAIGLAPKKRPETEPK